MSSRRFAALIGGLVFAGGSATCGRADLDALTRAPGTGGGGGGTTGRGGTVGSGGIVGTGGIVGSGGTIGSGGTVSCPAAVLPAGDTTQTVQVGTSSRTYLLHVPPAYDGTRRVPLILDFHFLSSSAARQRATSTFPDVVDPEGVLMAFPSGAAGPAGAAWNVGPCCVDTVDDVAFARAVVEDLRERACIDGKSVYATGMSMGGGMAYYLACHAADVFAAVAPAAFDMSTENVVGCQPSRPISVIAFRGDADTVVPYQGGSSGLVANMSMTFLGAQTTFKKWAELDGCTGAPSAPDGNGCSAYSTCQGGVEVVLCTKDGGNQEQGNATIAWPILKRHTL